MGLYYYGLNQTDPNGTERVRYTVGALNECTDISNSDEVFDETLSYVSSSYALVVSLFAILLNGWIVELLVVKREVYQLLKQSQHVYVLGCAINNVSYAIGGVMMWLINSMLPCLELGPVVCFIQNLAIYAGANQMMFNVCLICFDRWRLVRLGVKYDHKREVRRANW